MLDLMTKIKKKCHCYENNSKTLQKNKKKNKKNKKLNNIRQCFDQIFRKRTYKLLFFYLFHAINLQQYLLFSFYAILK